MNSIKIDHEYTIQGYCTFSVKVASDPFSGKTNFCLPVDSLSESIKFLEKMHHTLSGTYTITDSDSDDYLCFEFLSLGHLNISGQLGGSYNDQFLKFRFRTDQTELISIIFSLRTILSTQGTGKNENTENSPRHTGDGSVC